MKHYLILVCFFAVVSFVHSMNDLKSALPYLNLFQKEFVMCKKEIAGEEVGLSDINQFYVSIMKDPNPTDMCVLACMLEKKNLIQNEHLDAKEILAVVNQVEKDNPNKELLDKNVKECITEANDEPSTCRAAHKYVTCYMEKHVS